MSGTALRQRMPTYTNNGWTYWPLKRGVIAVTSLVTALIVFTLWAIGFRGIGLGWFIPIILATGAALVAPLGGLGFFGYQMTDVIRANRKAKKSKVFQTQSLREILEDPDDDKKQSHSSVQVVEPNIIPLAGGKSGYLTELRTPSNKRHTVLTVGKGIGAGIAESQSRAKSVSDSLGFVLKQIADEYGTNVRGALYFLRVPPNFTQAIAYYTRRKFETENPAVLKSQEIYERALVEAQQKTGNLLAGIGISVPRPSEWSKGITDDAVRRSIGYQITETLAQRLNLAMAYDIKRPDPFETAMVVHGMTDTLGLDNLYWNWFQDNELQDEKGVIDFNESLVMRSGILPHAWVQGHSYLRVNDTLSRTFYVPKFPYAKIPVGLLNTLYNPNGSNLMYGISAVYSVRSAQWEGRRNNLRRARPDAKSADRRRGGASARASEKAESRELDETDDFLFASQGAGISMRLMSFTVGGDWTQLGKNEATLRAMFRGNGLNLPLLPIVDRSLQVPARCAMFGVAADIDA